MSPSRVICLIDGEHHPEVVRDALDRVAAGREIAAVLFCGGGEKVAEAALADPAAHYGRPVTPAGGDAAAALARLAAESGAGAVIDLADEPAVDPEAKLRLACVALHHGLAFGGPGLDIRPQSYAEPPFEAPSLAVIGTGKRCGKTALGAHWARLLREAGRRPVVVSMGRGGPAEPALARAGTGLAELLELARAGRHAASDYLEDAVLAGVDTVGCRRAGGGIAGQPAATNLAAAAALAATLDPGVVLFEGSGATIPAMRCDRTLCVAGDRRRALGQMGPLRLMRADLVVLFSEDAELAAEVGAVAGAPAIRCRLVSEPVAELGEGARVAFFATSEAARLAGPEPLVASPNLARRGALAADLDRAAAEGCDTYLTELKAAAIEMVAERAEREGARVVFVANRPLALDGEPDLDQALLELARAA